MSRYSDAVMNLAPIAYWRLGEPAGTVAIDEFWTHHGTYVGSPTLGATGALSLDTNPAVTLNGSSQWVTVPTVSDLSLTSAFSIVAWAKRTGGANGAIFEKSIGGGVNTAYSLFFESGFVWGRAVKAAALTNVSTADPADAAWHLWTLTYDGTNLRLYMDAGAPSVSAAITAPLDGGAGGSFIGVLPNLAFPFGGSLDEIAVVGRALTASEISRLYAVGTETTTTNRAALVAGITTMMTAFIAAHPTLLVRHFDTRPKSVVTDWPCSYLDTLEMPELHWDSALRTTVFNPQIVFVFRETDPGETGDSIDALIDAMNDHLDSYPHIVAGTWWSDASWAEEAVPLSDSTSAAGVRLTITGLSFADGRL